MGIRVTKKTKTAFADLLKDWRARRRITQAEASAELGVPLRTLQNWEIARTAPHSSLRQVLESRLK
jgi:DNA-binding transcriptional regulator YiaG